MEQTESSLPQSTSSHRLSWLLVCWLAPTRIPKACKDISVAFGWRQTEIATPSCRWISGCRHNGSALLGLVWGIAAGWEGSSAGDAGFTREDPTLW